MQCATFEIGSYLTSLMIKHPTTKELKVSRDMIFSEKQFFDMQEVESKDGALKFEILEEGTENEVDMVTLAGEKDTRSEIRE